MPPPSLAPPPGPPPPGGAAWWGVPGPRPPPGPQPPPMGPGPLQPPGPSVYPVPPYGFHGPPPPPGFPHGGPPGGPPPGGPPARPPPGGPPGGPPNGGPQGRPPGGPPGAQSALPGSGPQGNLPPPFNPGFQGHPPRGPPGERGAPDWGPPLNPVGALPPPIGSRPRPPWGAAPQEPPNFYPAGAAKDTLEGPPLPGEGGRPLPGPPGLPPSSQEVPPGSLPQSSEAPGPSASPWVPPPASSGAAVPPEGFAVASGEPGGGASGKSSSELVAEAWEAQKRQEAELQERERAAWTAHKSQDGTVYYYNTITNESSWERPEGYKGDEDKASAVPVPVKSEKVKGTKWMEVLCDDGKHYYYNSDNKETSWTVPSEVVAARGTDNKQAAMAAVSEAAATIIARVKAASGGSTLRPDLKELAGGVTDGDTTSAALHNGMAALAASATAKQVLLAGGPRAAQGVPPGAPALNGNADEAVQRGFREMLSEKGVTAFSRWERELPRLLQDPRFQAVPTLRERRLLFDDYCKMVADEHKKAKGGGKKAAAEAFAVLLNEIAAGAVPPGDVGEEGSTGAGITADTTLADLEEGWGDDPRWKACDAKVRAEAVEARVAPLRKAAYEEAAAKKSALESGFKALLQERRMEAGARWSKVKPAISSDPRYKAVPRDEREHLFRTYLEEQEVAAQARRQERKEREDKERESRQRAAKDTEEAEKRRRKAAYHDAVANLNTLLSEVVKDCEAHWSDWKAKLERDPQGRATNPVLEKGDPEKLFREHVNQLHVRAITNFHELLEKVLRPLQPKKAEKGEKEELVGALRSWQEAEKVLSDDPRFGRAPPSQREKLWRRFVEDMIYERDNPGKFARRPGPGAPSRGTMGRGTSYHPRPDWKEDPSTDRAYQREYLEPDRKRIKRP
eukprot:jgi/Botrbrau1/12951/Bobra.154_2s0011.1